MGFSINGEVAANIEKFVNQQLPKELEKGLEKACLVIEGEAKSRCPVNDGQLRNSITHQVEGKKGEVGTNVEYAPYVELGTGIYATQGGGRQSPWSYVGADGQWHTTSGQHAQPYLKPAAEASKSKIEECFKGLI